MRIVFIWDHRDWKSQTWDTCGLWLGPAHRDLYLVACTSCSPGVVEGFSPILCTETLNSSHEGVSLLFYKPALAERLYLLTMSALSFHLCAHSSLVGCSSRGTDRERQSSVWGSDFFCNTLLQVGCNSLPLVFQTQAMTYEVKKEICIFRNHRYSCNSQEETFMW